MKINTKSLFNSVLIIAGFSILTRLSGFLFRIYLSRSLGAELLGVYQVAFSVFMVLIVVVSSGLPLSISKLTAVQRVNGDKRGEYGTLTSALIIGLITSIVLCIVILIFKDSLSSLFSDERCMQILITLLPAVVASAVYSSFRGALWGTQSYFSVSLAEFIEQVARIVAYVVMAEWLFRNIDGGLLAGESMSIACVVSAIFVGVIYFVKGRRLKSPKGYYKTVLKSAIPVTGVRVASSLIQPIIAVLFPTMLILAGYTNSEAMSSYGMAMGMTFPLLFLPSTIIGALSFALIPDLSTAIAQKDYKLVNNRIVSCLSFSLFVSMLIVPFYIGVGSEIGGFLYDNTASGIYLARASWIMIPLGLSNVTSSILNAFNLEVKSFINNILGGVVLLGVVALFSGMLGVDALIWGFGGCMTLTTILNLYMIKKHTHFSLNLTKSLIIETIFVVPIALIIKWSYPFLSYLFPEFLAIAIVGVASVGAFILLGVVFNLLDFASVWVKLKPKKRKKTA